MLPNQPTPFSIQHPPSAGRFDDVKKIDVRPRSSGTRAVESSNDASASADTTDAMLHFSCPACLHMLGTARQSVTVSVKCPECSTWVMPPQVVNMGATGSGKTTLPPPRKTGVNPLKG